MKDSIFYTTAYQMLRKEIDRLDVITDTLDENPGEKNEKIAEYKCAKYRSASVSRVFMTLYHGNRVMRQSCKHVDIETCLEKHPEYLALCEDSVADARIDSKLYYGISILTDERIEELTAKLSLANDWEKIELEERLGGLRFAKECLEKAWEMRQGEVS